MDKITKEDIVNIISIREAISFEEACDIIKETQWAINDCIANGGTYDDVEDIMLDYLQLEMDYVMPFLFHE